MSKKKQDEFRARLLAIRGGAKEASKTDTYNAEGAAADFVDANRGYKEASQELSLESKIAGAPANVRETAFVSRDEHVRDLKGYEGYLQEQEAQLRDTLDLVGEKSVELEAVKSDLRKVKEELKDADRKMTFDSNGRLREYSDGLHTRMMTTTSQDEAVVEAQKAHDTASYMRTLMGKGAKIRKRFSNELCRNFDDSYLAKKTMPEHMRALYTTGSNLGDEMIQTVLSAQVLDLWEMKRAVAQHIPSFNMPRGEFSLPVITSNPTVYLQSERTGDPGADYKSSNMGTDARSFVAPTLAALMYWSSEMDEDSIEAVSSFASRGFAAAVAAAEEDIILNGDTDNSLDTGLSLAADSNLRAYDGIRHAVQSGAKVDLSTYASATALSILGLMGKYGAGDMSNCVLATPPVMFAKYLLPSEEFRSFERLNSSASNVTGMLKTWYGLTVEVSDKLREDLNAAGIQDGVTETKSQLVFFNKDAYLMGRKRELALGTESSLISGQVAMVATFRQIMKKIEPSASLSEGQGYNMA